MKKLLIMLLAVVMLLGLCACAGDVEEPAKDGAPEAQDTTTKAEETEEPAAQGFTVNVVDADGNPVANVMVQICLDSCIPAKTDENGVAVFPTVTEVTDEHKLSVMSLPEGYSYEGEENIYLDYDMTEYTIEVSAS